MLIAVHTHGKERQCDLNSMMSLALATTPAEVAESALSNRSTTYDVNRHMYLRHTFVIVYCLEDGQVVDMHKHWMQAGGYPAFMLLMGIYLESKTCGGV